MLILCINLITLHGVLMTQVTLLKDFTKAIVSIEGEDIDVEELGDLPLSIVVNGKVRNIEKIELRKYVFTVPDDEGKNLPRPLFLLFVCQSYRMESLFKESRVSKSSIRRREFRSSTSQAERI